MDFLHPFSYHLGDTRHQDKHTYNIDLFIKFPFLHSCLENIMNKEFWRSGTSSIHERSIKHLQHQYRIDEPPMPDKKLPKNAVFFIFCPLK